jgi:Polysaccharide lyase
MLKQIIILFLVTILSTCGKVPTTEPNQPFDPFVGDFENGNFKGFYFLVPDTLINTKIVTNPVRKGQYALKILLNPTDSIFNGHRAELAIYNRSKYKTTVYYAFSFLIDTSYGNNVFNLICQWQDLPYYEQGENWEPTPNIRASSPPLALVYVNGHLEIKMNTSPTSNNQTFLVGESLPITKGKWYDVLAEIYWNDNSSAYIQFWLDGKEMTPFNGKDHRFYKRNLFNRAGNYFKFGQYRGKEHTSQPHTIYFDEVRVGTTKEEVLP